MERCVVDAYAYMHVHMCEFVSATGKKAIIITVQGKTILHKLKNWLLNIRSFFSRRFVLFLADEMTKVLKDKFSWKEKRAENRTTKKS